MNIVSYNLRKFQEDCKINNKKLALMLGCLPKEVRKMKKDSYQFDNSQIEKIAKIMYISEEELQTEMNERIDLQKRKIYGTNYMFLNYKVLEYKTNKVNYISAFLDFLFVLFLIIFLLTKNISLSINNTNALSILKTIFVIELLVFPFMYIAFPYLKIYFSKTYKAVLTSNLKEENKDEACGIILGCLRQSINKSVIPHLFTIFSEGVIALYCFLYLQYINSIDMCYLIMIIIFIACFISSIMAFTYFGERKGSIVSKGE